MFVVQVGANDGKRFDPLQKHLRKSDKGIFIEPIEYYFKELLRTYRKFPNFIFENVAIHTFDGYVKMYTIEIKKIKEIKKKSKNKQLQEVLKGVSSLYKDRNKLRTYKEYISEVEVKCMKFETLIKKYNIDHIDWLFMDTEGHDLILIANFPFQILKPRKIYFECPDNKPYMWSKEEKEEAYKILKKNNYFIKNIKFNKLAILK